MVLKSFYGSTLKSLSAKKMYKVNTTASRGVLFTVINLYRVSMGNPTNQRINRVPVIYTNCTLKINLRSHVKISFKKMMIPSNDAKIPAIKVNTFTPEIFMCIIIPSISSTI